MCFHLLSRDPLRFKTENLPLKTFYDQMHLIEQDSGSLAATSPKLFLLWSSYAKISINLWTFVVVVVLRASGAFHSGKRAQRRRTSLNAELKIPPSSPSTWRAPSLRRSFHSALFPPILSRVSVRMDYCAHTKAPFTVVPFEKKNNFMCSLLGFFSLLQSELVSASAWIRWNLPLGAGRGSYKCFKKSRALALIQNHLKDEHGQVLERRKRKKKAWKQILCVCVCVCVCYSYSSSA